MKTTDQSFTHKDDCRKVTTNKPTETQNKLFSEHVTNCAERNRVICKVKPLRSVKKLPSFPCLRLHQEEHQTKTKKKRKRSPEPQKKKQKKTKKEQKGSSDPKGELKY